MILKKILKIIVRKAVAFSTYKVLCME